MKQMKTIAKELKSFINNDNVSVKWETGSVTNKQTRYNLRIKTKETLGAHVDEIIASVIISDDEKKFSFSRGYWMPLKGKAGKLIKEGLEQHPWMRKRLKAIRILINTVK